MQKVKPDYFPYYGQAMPDEKLKKKIRYCYFSDIPSGNIDIHSHDYFEMMYILQGNGAVIGKENGDLISQDFSTGDLIVSPPFLMHYTDVPKLRTKYERLILHIDSTLWNSVCARLDNFTAQPDINQNSVYHLGFDSIPYLNATFRETITHILHADEFSLQAVKNTLENILIFVERSNRKASTEKLKSGKGIAKLAEQIIQAEYSDPLLSLSSIADRLYISQGYLVRTFKEEFEQTVYQAILSRRLSKAQELIRKGNLIKSVYLDVGFRDYNTFLKAYKKRYQTLPSASKE